MICLNDVYICKTQYKTIQSAYYSFFNRQQLHNDKFHRQHFNNLLLLIHQRFFQLPRISLILSLSYSFPVNQKDLWLILTTDLKNQTLQKFLYHSENLRSPSRRLVLGLKPISAPCRNASFYEYCRHRYILLIFFIIDRFGIFLCSGCCIRGDIPDISHFICTDYSSLISQKKSYSVLKISIFSPLHICYVFHGSSLNIMALCQNIS